MRVIRRFGAALGAALLGLVLVPATQSDALPNLPQLIPCAYATNGDYTLPNGATVTLNTDTLTLGANSWSASFVDDAAVFVFNTLRLATNSQLIVSGSKPAVILAHRQIITESGSELSVSPGTAGGGPGGSFLSGGGGAGGGGGGGVTGGGGGGGFGGVGGSGGDGGGIGGAAYTGQLLTAGSGGGGANQRSGGGGGGALALIANDSIVVNGVIRANGEHAPSGMDAGGGGGSGGKLVVRTPDISGSGSLSVRGGNGGPAASGTGSGGGGAGGRILFFTNNLSTSPTRDLAGGLPGVADPGLVGTAGGNGQESSSLYKQKVAFSYPGLVRQSTSWDLQGSLSSGTFVQEFTYGVRPLVPFMGDWDGDGDRTPGYYSAGVFHLRNDNSGGPDHISFTFGDARGFPVVGDWNGDGLDDVATYLNGVWKTRTTGCAQTTTFSFGSGNWPATVPVAGDWNGDGISGIGTYNLSTGAWTLRANPGGTPSTPDATVTLAAGSGKYPVTGDWNADGADSIGVKTTIANAPAIWYLSNNSVTAVGGDWTYNFSYGEPNDFPVVWSLPAV